MVAAKLDKYPRCLLDSIDSSDLDIKKTICAGSQEIRDFYIRERPGQHPLAPNKEQGKSADVVLYGPTGKIFGDSYGTH
jgi:hypothetical protein